MSKRVPQTIDLIVPKNLSRENRESVKRISPFDAYTLVRDGHASWDGRKLTLNTNGAARGLSCKVGATLAVAFQRKELWAQVALSQIRMQRERASA